MTVIVVRNRQKPFRVERARLHAPLPGRYFVHPKDQGVVPHRAFCRLQRATSEAITFAGFGVGSKGDLVSVHFKELGVLTGRISRTIGALMTVELQFETDSRRRKLDGLIGWLDRRHRLRLPENRRSNRFVPKDPVTLAMMPQGGLEEVYILDLSGSGAHIASSTMPRLGDPVMLGRVAGKVVRHTEEGFAMQFYENQPGNRVEALVSGQSIELI